MVIIRGRKWEKMGSCPRNMAFQLDKRVRVRGLSYSTVPTVINRWSLTSNHVSYILNN